MAGSDEDAGQCVTYAMCSAGQTETGLDDVESSTANSVKCCKQYNIEYRR